MDGNERSVSSGLRALPSVDRLINNRELDDALKQYGHDAVVEAIREQLKAVRDGVRRGTPIPTVDSIVLSVLDLLRKAWAPSLVHTINATGIIVHTNLGRAPLSDEALAAVAQVSRGYSNLEYDLEQGNRGSRHAHVSDLLARLTGAEAGLVVNNNAAAVYLVLSALAVGREVIISRGQAVEIGGGFRIPDVLRQSGAKLVEVGTTNRTYAADYERAVGPETALILRVHSSNFRLLGFVHEADIGELCEIGRRKGIPVLDDLGSGALLDTSPFGLAREPMPQDSLSADAALVCFSGDKLLGGPQAGLVVGRKDLVEQIRRHPLARALRVDKMTLAALQATLLHYAKGEALEKIPVWRAIATPLEALEEPIGRWREELAQSGVRATLFDSEAAVGGGSLPGETLPSKALAISDEETGRLGITLDALAARLRSGSPAVVARIERNCLLFDARTVQPGEEGLLIPAILAALGKQAAGTS